MPPLADVQHRAELFERLPAPVVLVDAGTGTPRYANRAAERYLADLEASGLLARAAGGELLHNAIVRAAGRDLLAESGPLHLDGEDLVAIELRDVTELEAERRRHHALAEATRALAASRDFDDTLRTVARVLVPEVADWCFVELLRPDGAIERRVIQGADPAKHALAHRYNERYPLDPEAPAGSPAVIRSGEPQLMPDLPFEVLESIAQDDEHVELLRTLGFRSALVVPLRVDGEVVGDLALSQAESGRRFGPDDLEHVEELAARCSLLLAVQRREAVARAAREELAAIIEGVADAIIAQDATGQIVFVNSAAAELLGYPRAEAMLDGGLEDIRARFSLMAADGTRIAPVDMPARRALRGEAAEPVLARLRRDGGHPGRWLRIKARPVLDADARPRLAISVIEDVTEIKQAEQAQRFLAEASRVLAGSLDVERTLEAVAGLVVPEIADWCAVHLATPTGVVALAVRGGDGAAGAGLTARATAPVPDRAILRVLDTGQPELTVAAQDGGPAVGAVSSLVVPMAVRERVMGTIWLATAESGRVLGAADLALAGDLATRAAAAVDNARLYRERSAIAHTLQTSLLPPELPDIPNLECAAVFQASGDAYEVGGDFYDVFSTARDEWFAVIGDVCGKGATAAATTALVRYTVRAAAVRRRSPARILEFLNETMLRSADAPTRFCTLAVVRLDLLGEEAQLTVASGGHPLPRIVRAGGTVSGVGAPGTLIGVTPEMEVRDARATLDRGDTLVLYTDGLTEAGAPGRVWSPEDLDAALGGAWAAAGGSAAGLVEAVAGAALGDLGADPRDDVAVLALRRR